MRIFRLISSLPVALLLASRPAWVVADDEALTYDRVTLAVAVQEQVKADLLVADLVAQREGKDVSALAGEVNALIDRALEQSASVSRVSVETRGYETTPRYTKGTLTGWRVRQVIRLQSRDAAALSGLVGGLQAYLMVQSLTYRVSHELRTQVEDVLIKSGIAAFRARAALIAEQMQQPGYRVVEMRVTTEEDRPGPVRSAGLAVMAADAVPPPRIEPGARNIRARVSGVVELQVQ